jgi:hypothetical protein
LTVALHVQVGELEEALSTIKWGTDYLLNCHVEPKKFVAMYGSSEVHDRLTTPNNAFVTKAVGSAFVKQLGKLQP